MQQRHFGRVSGRKPVKGNVFQNALRYFTNLNSLVEVDDEEHANRRNLRIQARTWKRKGNGRTLGKRPGRLLNIGEKNR